MGNVNPIQMEKYLKGVDYPASKDDLLQCAKRNGADQQICDAIQHLPNQQFAKPTDVTKAVSASSRSESR